MSPLKFVVFEGNNSNILRKVMQSRMTCNMPEICIAGSPSRIAKGDQTTTASEGESNLQSTANNDKAMAQNYSTW